MVKTDARAKGGPASGGPAPGGITLTPEQIRSRRTRNIAVGLLVGLLIVLIYVLTIAKLGPGVLDRPL